MAQDRKSRILVLLLFFFFGVGAVSVLAQNLLQPKKKFDVIQPGVPQQKPNPIVDVKNEVEQGHFLKPALLGQIKAEEKLPEGQVVVVLPKGDGVAILHEWTEIARLVSTPLKKKRDTGDSFGLRLMSEMSEGGEYTFKGERIAVGLTQKGDLLFIDMSLYQEEALDRIFGQGGYQFYTAKDVQKVDMLFFLQKNIEKNGENSIELMKVPEVNVLQYDIPQEVKRWFLAQDIRLSYGNWADKPWGHRGLYDETNLLTEEGLIRIYDILSSLPESHVEGLKIRFESKGTVTGGHSGGGYITIDQYYINDTAISYILVHEIGHYVNEMISRGSEQGSDPSDLYYALSWTGEGFKAKGDAIDHNGDGVITKEDGFLSGYATTNSHEDFAEHYAFYYLEGDFFRSATKVNPIFGEKYYFFRGVVFDGREYSTSMANESEEDAYWIASDYDFFLKQREPAVAQYEKFLEQYPNSTRVPRVLSRLIEITREIFDANIAAGDISLEIFYGEKLIKFLDRFIQGYSNSEEERERLMLEEGIIYNTIGRHIKEHDPVRFVEYLQKQIEVYQIVAYKDNANGQVASFRIGSLLEGIGEYEKAVPYYRRVVEIMPFDYYGELAQKTIITIYLDFLNDIPGAQQELQRYREFYPNNSDTIRTFEEKINQKKELNDLTVESLIKALSDENASVQEASAKQLGEIGNSRAIEALIKSLDTRITMTVRLALIKIGKPAVGPLLKALGDPTIRVAVVYVLGYIGDPSAVNPLIKLLEDPEVEVRRAVTYALGKIGDPGAIESLTRILADQEAIVRESAINALVKIGDIQILPFLVEVLDDEDASVRGAAVSALAEIGKAHTRQTIEFVLEKTEGRTEEWLSTVSRLLADIGEAIGDPLITALGSENLNTRDVAERALIFLGDTKVVGPLRNRIGLERNGVVRQRMEEVLQRIENRIEERRKIREEIKEKFGIEIDERFKKLLGSIKVVLENLPDPEMIKGLRWIRFLALEEYLPDNRGHYSFLDKEIVLLDTAPTVVLFHEVAHFLDDKYFDLQAFVELHKKSIRSEDFAYSYGEKNWREDFATTADQYFVDTRRQFLRAIKQANEGNSVYLEKLLFMLDVFTGKFKDGHFSGMTARLYQFSDVGGSNEDSIDIYSVNGEIHAKGIPVDRDGQGHIIAIGGIRIYNPDGSYNLEGLTSFFEDLKF